MRNAVMYILFLMCLSLVGMEQPPQQPVKKMHALWYARNLETDLATRLE